MMWNNLRYVAVHALATVVMASGSAAFATAYGSINNFDAVNDNGTECHDRTASWSLRHPSASP